MPVVPGEPDGVGADILHADELQIRPDRCRIERPLPGPLIAARRAGALNTKQGIRYAVDVLAGPGDLEYLVGLEGANVRWRVGH